MKKKIFRGIIGASLATMMVTGCTSGGMTQTTVANVESTTQIGVAREVASTDLTGTIKVAALEGGYGSQIWSDVAKAFEETYPGVTVDLTVDKKIEDVISPAMKAGDFPDVVHCATGREAGLTETLTKEKALLALSDVLEMTVPGEDVLVKDKILPGFLDTLGTNPYGDGVTYYAPMFYSPCGLFYNAGLFEEKGWEVPKTWEDMWTLGKIAAAEDIALFTYPTAGYFDAFTFALLESSGGMDFYNRAMVYTDGVWESEEASAVFNLIGNLATYTEKTTVANANGNDYQKNQQLILDNKALFVPNGTWLPGEMAEAPRADGFSWGFAPVPAVDASQKPSSFTFFEQMWIPAGASNQDLAKAWIAFMYTDKAAEIFATGNAVQPIEGAATFLDEESQLYYTIYDNDNAVAVMGGFASTSPVEGVSMADSLFNAVNSVMSKDKSVADWQADVEATSDKLRAAME